MNKPRKIFEASSGILLFTSIDISKCMYVHKWTGMDKRERILLSLSLSVFLNVYMYI